VASIKGQNTISDISHQNMSYPTKILRKGSTENRTIWKGHFHYFYNGKYEIKSKIIAKRYNELNKIGEKKHYWLVLSK
jgi:hypothetical protein